MNDLLIIEKRHSQSEDNFFEVVIASRGCSFKPANLLLKQSAFRGGRVFAVPPSSEIHERKFRDFAYTTCRSRFLPGRSDCDKNCANWREINQQALCELVVKTGRLAQLTACHVGLKSILITTGSGVDRSNLTIRCDSPMEWILSAAVVNEAFNGCQILRVRAKYHLATTFYKLSPNFKNVSFRAQRRTTLDRPILKSKYPTYGWWKLAHAVLSIGDVP